MNDHKFKRESSKKACSFCFDKWPSAGNSVFEYVQCEICKINAHTSCKQLVIQNMLCKELEASVGLCSNIDSLLPLRSPRTINGKLSIRLHKIADVPSAQGVLLYGLWKVPGLNFNARTESATVTSIECVWPESIDHFEFSNIKATPTNFTIKLELWSNFYGLLDKLYFETAINLLPLFLFPGIKLERWFPLSCIAVIPIPGANTCRALIEMIYTDSSPVSQQIDSHLPKTDQGVENLSNNIHPNNVSSFPTDLNVSAPNEHNTLSNKAIESQEDTVAPNIEKDCIVANPPEEYRINTLHSMNENIKEPEGNEDMTIDMLPVVDQPEYDLNNVRSRLSSRDNADRESTSIKSSSASPSNDTSKLSKVSDTSVVINQAIEGISSYFNGTMSNLGNFLYALENSPGTLGVISEAPKNEAESPVAPTSTVGTLSILLNELKLFANDMVSDGNYRISIAIQGEAKERCSVPLYRSAVKWYAKDPLVIQMPHYRAIAEISIVELTNKLNSKTKLGIARISSYEVMQRESDAYINSKLYAPLTELLVHDVSNKTELGWMDCKISFKEDLYNHFWSMMVKLAPSSPDEDLSLERLSTHIARAQAMIAVFTKCYEEYLHIMSWKDPLLTASLFLIFLYCTVYVKAPYALSGFMFIFVALMTRTWFHRKYGFFKDKYIKSAIKNSQSSYLPVSSLKVGVLGFHPPQKMQTTSAFGFLTINEDSGMQEPEIKLSFVWDRSIETQGVEESYIGLLGLSEDSFDVPATGVSQFVSSLMKTEGDRLHMLLSNVFDSWPISAATLAHFQKNERPFIRSKTSELGLVFPVFQNSLSKQVDLASESSTNQVGGVSQPLQQQLQQQDEEEGKLLKPWMTSRAMVKVILKHEAKSSFLDNDEECIYIPVKDVINHGKLVDNDDPTYELIRWYKPNARSSGQSDSGKFSTSSDIFLFDESNAASAAETAANSSDAAAPAESNSSAGTEILIRIALTLPDIRRAFSPTNEECKVSDVLQTVLFSRDGKESRSTTFTVLWNMRDHVKFVQNVLFMILDYFESFKNIFNWTIPSKTRPIYLSLVVVWISTIFVPSQTLILLLGLYQFLYVILPIPDGNELTIRFFNLLQSIPNDDDLLHIYEKEKKQFAQAQLQHHRKDVREVLLNATFTTLWSGNIQLKSSRRSSIAGILEWAPVYLVFQGRRLVWWGNSEEIDKGRVPAGQLILSQVSGITQISPVDVRQFEKEQQLIAIFGEDPQGKPLKIALFFPDLDSKEEFEAVLRRVLKQFDEM